MASQGHAWHDLIDGYPVALIKNLYKAVRINQRRAMIELAVGLSVAISHAIEVALGGKGKILPTWIDNLERLEQTGEAMSNKVMSNRARQFFLGQPVRK